MNEAMLWRLLRSSFLCLFLGIGMPAVVTAEPLSLPTMGWSEEKTFSMSVEKAVEKVKSRFLAEGWTLVHEIPLADANSVLLLWEKEGRRLLALLRKVHDDSCTLVLGNG